MLAAEVDLKQWTQAINTATTERGIKANRPSDALDASRDVILLEAAMAVNAHYEIVDNTIRLWRSDLTINWEASDG